MTDRTIPGVPTGDTSRRVDRPARPRDQDVLGAALELAALGLPVLPLGPGSKRPRLARWQERATCRRRTIRRWFDRRPGDNLGLLTGAGLAALDIDRAAGATSRSSA